MKTLIVFGIIFLSGCASIPDDLQIRLQQESDKHIQLFNHIRGTNLPFPSVEVIDMHRINPNDEVGSEDEGVISFDRGYCTQNLDDCLNEFVPHEDAHYVIDKLVKPIPSFKGKGFYTPSHDFQWCDVMKVMGGHPEKHGYCINL